MKLKPHLDSWIMPVKWAKQDVLRNVWECVHVHACCIYLRKKYFRIASLECNMFTKDRLRPWSCKCTLCLFPCSYFLFRISGCYFLSYCVCRENVLTIWFIGLHKHHTNPNRMWANPFFFPSGLLFSGLSCPLQKYAGGCGVSKFIAMKVLPARVTRLISVWFLSPIN